MPQSMHGEYCRLRTLGLCPWILWRAYKLLCMVEFGELGWLASIMSLTRFSKTHWLPKIIQNWLPKVRRTCSLRRQWLWREAQERYVLKLNKMYWLSDWMLWWRNNTRIKDSGLIVNLSSRKTWSPSGLHTLAPLLFLPKKNWTRKVETLHLSYCEV